MYEYFTEYDRWDVKRTPSDQPFLALLLTYIQPGTWKINLPTYEDHALLRELGLPNGEFQRWRAKASCASFSLKSGGWDEPGFDFS